MGIFNRNKNEPDDQIKETDLDERPSNAERTEGKIIFLNHKEGWGFISSHDDRVRFTRIFFHWLALEADTLHFTELKNRMKVEFDLVQNEDNTWKALHVRVMED